MNQEGEVDGENSPPGCPAHSNPSIESMSTPRRSADFACRIEVHLGNELGRKGSS